NDSYCGKFLVIEPGFRCSLHYHPRKHETFVAIVGEVVVESGVGDGQNLTILDPTTRVPFEVPPGLPHRFWSADGRPAVLVEVSTPHSDDDVVRLEESGPLVPNVIL